MTGLPSPGRVRKAGDMVAETSAGNDRFLEMARKVAATGPAVVLMSGGQHDCGRYSLAMSDPFMVVRGRGTRIEIVTPDGIERLDADPLEVIDHLLDRMRPEGTIDDLPFLGGCAGYLAYELKNVLEKLPQTAHDDLGLPDLYMLFPRRIAVHDRVEKTIRLVRLESELGPSPLSPASPPVPPERYRAPHRLRSNISRSEYLDAVARIRRYIREGDVYQVNLSQRFSYPLDVSPFDLWTRMFEMNPAPFFAYVNGSDHQVLSTSMERFLFRRGDLVETRPIKGTRRRGDDEVEDRALERDLLAHVKDDAELSMIVDLLRNDLGKVCSVGTVRVERHKSIEQYRNVFHLVSVVSGRLQPDVGHGDLLRAAFPGGSITGCPKIRAMEIIDELEPNVRHAYTGAIGYLGWHGNLDLNIGIRTAICHRGAVHFSAGGGVVYDSDDREEYRETIHKARTMIEAISGDRSFPGER